MIQAPRLAVIGRTFALATVDETVLERPVGWRLGIVRVIAHAPSASVSPSVTLKSGPTLIGVWALTAGDTETLLEAGADLLELDGPLVAQVSGLGIRVSAWARGIRHGA